jgi:hypothetical protein
MGTARAGIGAAAGAFLGALAGSILNEATGPKADNAPGVSAGGQPTNERGEKLGPSGKPVVHEADMSSKKRAKDAARNAGQGKPAQHPSPKVGKPHFHPTDQQGNKIPGSTHYNYPD